ncbi:MAG TPA: hypothetical protein VJY34_06955 [Roseiarcus sp.]|nr:hypothetical protein [Roseiarcus sp.]
MPATYRSNSLLAGNLQGISRQNRQIKSEKAFYSKKLRKIPCEGEQGIFSAEQGTSREFFRESREITIEVHAPSMDKAS